MVQRQNGAAAPAWPTSFSAVSFPTSSARGLGERGVDQQTAGYIDEPYSPRARHDLETAGPEARENTMQSADADDSDYLATSKPLRCHGYDYPRGNQKAVGDVEGSRQSFLIPPASTPLQSPCLVGLYSK